MTQSILGRSNQVVLLISIDTLRQDHLGCYGYHRDTTPFIDHLAAHGKRYARAFTPVPTTFPAHACMFTSRYPGWNGVSVHNGGYLRSGSTWMRLLHDVGVRTAGFVSSFVLDRRMTNGFDLAHFDDAMTLTELNRSELRRRGEATVDAALQWFATVPSEGSVFCLVHLMDVHGTYDVPAKVAGQFVQPHYVDDTLPICKMFSPGGIPDIFRLDRLADFPGKQVGAYYVDRYDGCIAYVDQQIERLVENISQKFGSRLTCLIVSDHGEAFGEDQFWCTHSHGVTPSQTQVPFIVWSADPDLSGALVEPSAPVSLLDIGPTILELFGATRTNSEKLHGWSLFDQRRRWAARRLFAVSYTQLLAYDSHAQEGIVIGDQTSSYEFSFNPATRRSYLDQAIEPSDNAFAVGMFFHSLATQVGVRLKSLAATFFERQEINIVAQRLAELGYIDAEHSGSDRSDIDQFIQPLPMARVAVDWQLPHTQAEELAIELQIRPALDLGCGNAKQPGFIGLDRLSLPTVDVTGNLDAPLPFADDTFDLVVANHAIEHVRALLPTLQEIYRVCRHGAQVCIVAPYVSQGLNWANPYHHQSFNEHSPRFWTPSPQTLLSVAEYRHPHAATWGLSKSDNSDPKIDLRCMRMEFFYFAPYRNLPIEEQRAARKKYIDVCDQIVYHLLVVKEPISEADMLDLSEQLEYYDPPAVARRRLQERLEARESELTQAEAALSAKQREFEQTQSSLTTLRNELNLLLSRLSSHEVELESARTAISSRDLELEEHQAALFAREKQLEQAQAALADREKALGEVQASLSALARDVEQVRTAQSSCEMKLQETMLRGKAIAGELESLRHGRAIRVLNRFLDRSDARDQISPAFQQLKDDSLIFTHDLNGFRLQPSQNLQHLPFVYYPLDLNRQNLAGILLAAILDFPWMNGEIGIELVSPANSIVAQCAVPLCELDVTLPIRFKFPVIQDSDKGRYWLRVFARDADAPIRIFEWRKYSFRGFGPLHASAFCGIVFGA